MPPLLNQRKYQHLFIFYGIFYGFGLAAFDCFNTLIKFIATNYHLSEDHLNYSTSLNLIACSMGYMCHVLFPSFGDKRTIACLGVVFAIGCQMIISTINTELLFCGRFLQGFCFSFIQVNLLTLMRQRYKTSLGRHLSIAACITEFLCTILPLLALISAMYIHWNMIFHIIALVIVALTFNVRHAEKHHSPAMTTNYQDFIQTLKNKNYFRYNLANTLFNAVNWGILTSLVFFFNQSHTNNLYHGLFYILCNLIYSGACLFYSRWQPSADQALNYSCIGLLGLGVLFALLLLRFSLTGYLICVLLLQVLAGFSFGPIFEKAYGFINDASTNYASAILMTSRLLGATISIIIFTECFRFSVQLFLIVLVILLMALMLTLKPRPTVNLTTQTDPPTSL